MLLIAGLGDPIEAWQFQLDGLSDRYHTIAYDNRGVGRTPLPEAAFSVATMADDAAAVLRGLGVERRTSPASPEAALSPGNSPGAIPTLVKSLVLVGTFAYWDTFARTAVNALRWQAEAAPSERAFLEAFYTWIYTPRAHENGMVRQIIDELLKFPYPTSMETIQRTFDVYLAHGDVDRLADIDVPTLVLTGELDLICPPRHGRVVAEGIPGARFEVLAGEAHQPFQESPEMFNRRVDRVLAADRGTGPAARPGRCPLVASTEGRRGGRP